MDTRHANRSRKSRGGSLWTPANIVTCIRVALIPIWLLVAQACIGADFHTSNVTFALISAILYSLLALTDKIDGYLARSRNEITVFGRFLDPIADKLLVVAALLYLLELGVITIWIPIIILAREFLVSGLRMVLAVKGVVVSASNLGKWKTATTLMAICGMLFAYAFPDTFFQIGLELIANLMLWVAVGLTIWSGIDYFSKGLPYLTEE